MKYFMIIIKSTYELDGILKFFLSSVLEILVIKSITFYSVIWTIYRVLIMASDIS